MQFSTVFAAIMATVVTAAPSPDNSAKKNDLQARGGYDCGRNAYYGDDCCECYDEGYVYNPHWGGCDKPNVEIDIQFGCEGGSYYDYHRGCCSCPKTEIEIYFSKEKSCGSCGDNAYYDYDHNDCYCNYDNYYYDWDRHGCYEY